MRLVEVKYLLAIFCKVQNYDQIWPFYQRGSTDDQSSRNPAGLYYFLELKSLSTKFINSEVLIQLGLL